MYALVRRELDAGRQAYVVYPLIEEVGEIDSQGGNGDGGYVARTHLSAESCGAVALQDAAGRQRAGDEAFAAGEIHVLVSTTVIEVGIDVPNATVMVIEHSERFGLTQLHQLRGRVGRGAHQSYCVLLYQYPISELGKARLQALADTTDGFEIAERDLELRGPETFFGTSVCLPTLRTGDLVRDHSLRNRRGEAERFLDDNLRHARRRMKGLASRFGLWTLEATMRIIPVNSMPSSESKWRPPSESDS